MRGFGGHGKPSAVGPPPEGAPTGPADGPIRGLFVEDFMSFWKWSRAANSNASADASINWAEGQPPSSVNDSARAMMAAAAKFRDDISGAITTGGTATAYTVTSYQTFD